MGKTAYKTDCNRPHTDLHLDLKTEVVLRAESFANAFVGQNVRYSLILKCGRDRFALHFFHKSHKATNTGINHRACPPQSMTLRVGLRADV